jgi:hypothetical protein
MGVPDGVKLVAHQFRFVEVLSHALGAGRPLVSAKCNVSAADTWQLHDPERVSPELEAHNSFIINALC